MTHAALEYRAVCPVCSRTIARGSWLHCSWPLAQHLQEEHPYETSVLFGRLVQVRGEVFRAHDLTLEPPAPSERVRSELAKAMPRRGNRWIRPEAST